MLLLLLLLLFLSVVILLLYDRFRRATRLLLKIPGPKRLPFLGNSYHFLLSPDKLFSLLHSLYKDYGGVVQMHAINIQYVCLFNPDDIGKIMSSHQYIDKMEPYSFLKPWLGDGLLTSSGKKWRQRRKLLTPTLHFNILKKYSKIFTEQTNDFLKLIDAEVGKVETDLRSLVSRKILHVMCGRFYHQFGTLSSTEKNWQETQRLLLSRMLTILETTMGSSMSVEIESVMEKYFKAIEIFGESTIARTCRAWLYFDVLFKWSNLAYKQKQALSDLHTLTNQIIIDRKEFLKNKNVTKKVEDDEGYSKKGRPDMLDLLLENEKLGYINIEGVREEVDTFIFEGHDTTATALSFFIMAIANEPVIQAKIYEEMRNIFCNSQRSATIQDLNEMTYLECCIKESLRLYPSVPIITRHITEELILSGYTIPANTGYQVLIYDLHRRADLYPEPERFIPERFLPENCSKRHPYAYIPFSAGPRNCIGQKFAMLEMKTLVSSLLRKFRIEPITKPSDLKYGADIILRTHEQPINVRFCKRLEENITQLK